MTDTLLDITRASLEEYASYIAKNSNGVIEVSGTGLKDVTCNYPERKELKRKLKLRLRLKLKSGRFWSE